VLTLSAATAMTNAAAVASPALKATRFLCQALRRRYPALGGRASLRIVRGNGRTIDEEVGVDRKLLCRMPAMELQSRLHQGFHDDGRRLQVRSRERPPPIPQQPGQTVHPGTTHADQMRALRRRHCGKGKHSGIGRHYGHDRMACGDAAHRVCAGNLAPSAVIESSRHATATGKRCRAKHACQPDRSGKRGQPYRPRKVGGVADYAHGSQEGKEQFSLDRRASFDVAHL